jgi:hypothetical protein
MICKFLPTKEQRGRTTNLPNKMLNFKRQAQEMLDEYLRNAIDAAMDAASIKNETN